MNYSDSGMSTVPLANRWRNLLWVDSIAGLVVGTLTLAMVRWLSRWYGLPHDLLVLMGTANLVYGTYSLSLAIRPKRPKILIGVLITANLLWAVLCVWWVVQYGATVSIFGRIYLIGEALFVGGLALLEWRWRELLRFKAPETAVATREYR